jgi:predicted small secreted protein
MCEFRTGGAERCRSRPTKTAMNSIHKPTLVALALSLIAALAFTGCNTMRGLGQDTERAGEKIQENAKR